MLTIWGMDYSSNVQKAVWAAAEVGLEFKRIDLAGKHGGNLEPVYLAKNPNGLVPTIQDGDFTLWESNAIVRYLARRYGVGTLEPTDALSCAVADQWMEWQVTVLGPAIYDAYVGLRRTAPEQRDATKIAASQAKTIEKMKMLEARLEKSAFVAGNDFSMGDIPVGIMTRRFLTVVPERPSFRCIEAWYGKIQARAPFRTYIESVPLI